MQYLTKTAAFVVTPAEYAAVRRWAKQQKMSQSAALCALVMPMIYARLAAQAAASHD